MADSIKSSELSSLVAQAVEQALKQRNISDADLQKLLHGPLTVGLLPVEHDSLGADTALLLKNLTGAKNLGEHKPHLIGFVGKDFAAINEKIQQK